jgi:hypothetical protein
MLLLARSGREVEGRLCKREGKEKKQEERRRSREGNEKSKDLGQWLG